MSVHFGDVGTVFTVLVQDVSDILDVSPATSLQIYFQRPNNGSIFGPRTLVKVNGGSDGLVSYTWGSGELDTVGEWQYQIYLTFPTGVWHSDFGKFTVYPNMV